MKKATITQLKKKLDKVFSEWIRRSFANINGDVICYTFGKVLPWKQAHCGHFISRSYLATRFDPDNCRPQCIGCNLFGNGKPLDFEENLVREIGKKKVEALKQKRHQITKDYPYVSEIERYQRLLIEL